MPTKTDPGIGRWLELIHPKTTEEIKEVHEVAVDCFEYHEWNEEQRVAGSFVRGALQNAFETIIQYVPPSADRSTALRKLREARMDCNSAITHRGRY